MPAPDRLQQLLRQRALLQDHLAWLDREIAEASSGATAPVPPPVARAAQQPLVIPSPVTPPSPTLLAARPAPSFVASQAAQILSAAAAGSSSPPAGIETAADQILEQYRVAPDATKTDVKKGCLLYFFAAFVLLGLVVVGMYFFFQRGR